MFSGLFLVLVLFLLACFSHKVSGEMSIPLNIVAVFLQIFKYVFIGNFCHGEKYFVPLGDEALHVVILQLDSQ